MLAHPLSMRATEPGDFDAVLALIIECDVDELGAPDYDAANLRGDWSNGELADISRVVVDADGRLAGYALAYDRMAVRLTGAVSTRPQDRGRGVGTALTRWLVERAMARMRYAPDGARVILEFGTSADNAAAMELLANEGFVPHRYMLRMTIEFGGPLVAPAWPEGITLHTFEAGKDDEATYEAVEESFADHWGHARRPYEDWRRRTIEHEHFDPAIWFLAKDGDEIAGITICTDHEELSEGWIGTVGVRRPWRRTGVALALLQHAFAVFRQRGRTKASLGVDAQSLTGATRLYEKAGMHLAHRFAMCARELRPGIELTTQELAP